MPETPASGLQKSEALEPSYRVAEIAPNARVRVPDAAAQGENVGCASTPRTAGGHS